jgi:hypothetical protein
MTKFLCILFKFIGCFYAGVGLCYAATTLHLHFLKIKYHDKLKDENFLFALEEHPVSMIPFSSLFQIEVIIFSSLLASNIK